MSYANVHWETQNTFNQRDLVRQVMHRRHDAYKHANHISRIVTLISIFFSLFVFVGNIL